MNTDLKELRRKRNEGFRIILLSILPVMFVVVFFMTYSTGYYKEKEYIVTVKDKEMLDDTLLVSTQLEDGESRVFAVSNSLVKQRFHNAEDYFGIEVNAKYRFIVIGYRNEPLGMYENVISYEKLEWVFNTFKKHKSKE